VVDGGHPTVDTFLIRPNAHPAKILEKACPTWPDNRGCTVIANIKICLRALEHPERKPRFVLDTLKNPDISADFSKAVFENLPKNQIQENS